MRLFTLVLLFSAGAAALCQSPATALPDQPAPPAPAPPRTAPPREMPAPRDFSKFPRSWRAHPFTLGKNLFSARLPGVKTAERWSGTQIDPGMIVHPPSTRIGALPPGTPIAQDQFPKLVYQPIQLQGPRAQPFSKTWPALKVQRISTTWPNFTLLPVQSKTPRAAQVPAKD